MKLGWVIPDFEQAFDTSSLCLNLCKGTFIQTKSEKNPHIYRVLSCGGSEELLWILSQFSFWASDLCAAWNNLHRVFGRWLLIWRKVLPGHIRLIWGAHSSGRIRKGWELMDQALGCGVRLRFGSCYPHFRKNLLKGEGIKCVYFSLQTCVSLAVCLGNRSHFSEVDWKSLCIFLCCETCKLCSD